MSILCAESTVALPGAWALTELTSAELLKVKDAHLRLRKLWFRSLIELKNRAVAQQGSRLQATAVSVGHAEHPPHLAEPHLSLPR
jgi:hypothetical protein